MQEIEIELMQEVEEQEIKLSEETQDEQEISLKNEPALYTVSGIGDYEPLDNKPQINNVELIGNKTLEELGIKQEYTANDITFEDGSNFQEKYDSGELKGEQGIQGIAGKDGYTPIKGKDYYTEADKQEMVQLVLASLPSSEGVSY